MTFAHKSSRLSMRNTSPVLPEGMILFPLDGRVIDTLDSIPVLSNTVSQSSNFYKFYQSIAVESSTVNLKPTTVIEGMNGISFAYVSKENGYDKYSISGTWNNGTYPYCFNLGTYNYKAGINYSINCFLYTNVPEKFASFGTINIVNDSNMTGDNRAIRIGNYSARENYIHSVDMTNAAYIVSQPISNGTVFNPSTDFVYIKDVQIEQKTFSTSYTDSSRGFGILKYDISSLGMKDAGCISCWIFNSSTMINTNGQSNIFMVKMGSYSTDWYSDSLSLEIAVGSNPRTFRFRTHTTNSTNSDMTGGTTPVSSLGLGSWNHFVLQWNKNGLPSGNTKEMYINGVLEAGNSTNILPQNMLTYLLIGNWDDANNVYQPSTMYEQLAIHPGKGFAPDVIENWYKSNAPFFDPRDAFAFI